VLRKNLCWGIRFICIKVRSWVNIVEKYGYSMSMYDKIVKEQALS